MEMREKRSGERHYLVWDPLQLREGIRGAAVVRRSAVNFHLYRVFRGKVEWRCMERESVIVLHGEDREPTEFIARLARQSRLGKFSEGLDLEFYDFIHPGEESRHGESALALDDKISYLRYHPYEDNLESFVDKLLEHRRSIRDEVKKSGGGEPTKKRLQFIFAALGPHEVDELASKPLLQVKVESLAKNSSMERIHLFLFASQVSNFPPKVVAAFDMQFFLGEEAQRLCMERIHRDVEPKGESVYQLRIGCYYDSTTGDITPIHNLRYTPSAWLLARDRERESAEAQYRKILEELYDGT